MVPDRTQMVRAYLLSALVVLVAAGGSLLYMETASIKLWVPEQSLGVQVTLTSLPTQHIQANITESQQGSASTVQISPTYASGQVVFSCSPACQRAPVIIAQGQLITTAKSLGYATQAPATITTTTGSATVTVRATSPGAAWNADVDTLKVIANNSDSGLTVTNPAAIAGGANARSAQVIQQSDYFAVSEALTIKVTNELGAALNINAHGMLYVGDPEPVITITSDHNVGDETPSFTIKMTGTIGGTAFSESQAKAIVLAALQAKIPPGQELTNDPVQIIYQGQQAAPDTGVIVIAKAEGFVIPKLSPQSLSAQIRGLSPAAAAHSLQRAAPGSLVDIQISPAAAPFLPLIAEHIAVTVIVQPNSRAKPAGL
jgi:hypothetical protein